MKGIDMEIGPLDLTLKRRDLLIAGAASAATVAVPHAGAQPTPASVTMAKVSLDVNGQAHTLELDTRTTLLDALREELHLTGSKKGCDQGQCGACTVFIDGRRVTSCLTLAVMQQGHRVTTIEGLGTPAKLHPMQAAFVKHDGFQCGFCTPGQIMSAVGLLREGDAGDDLERIREGMSGNLCRCAAYVGITEAVRAAGQRIAEDERRIA
jgi:xanthine dehydrogenase YagT iron-sulfur-binding subunit